MTRRLGVVLVALALVATATSLVLAVREREPAARRAQGPSEASALALLVVETADGALPVVAGSTGFGQAGALVIPPRALVTVPGQGEATVAEALGLPPRQAATAIGNLLGLWIDHHASVEAAELAALADAAGGVEIGGGTADGEDLLALLAEPGAGDVTAIAVVLEALLAAEVDWGATDWSAVSRPGPIREALSVAAGTGVVVLEADEVASGVLRADPEQVSRALVDAFGGPAEPAIPVIVLNGNGVPGIGEQVAELLLPGGFRVAVSQNASTFDHLETLVVVGSADDVALGERVADLLGVGSVSVSVGSGIAPVTVVVGRDFTG